MAETRLLDEPREVIEPILPGWSPRPEGGQPRLDDRNALSGILFVLKAGIPWGGSASEDGCRCGMTCLAWAAHFGA